MSQIPEIAIQKRLKLDNPWWIPGWSWDNDEHAKLPRRRYFYPLKELILARNVRRAVVVLGPRRVGKTVMVNQVIAELLKSGISGDKIFFASLDTPAYSGLGLEHLIEQFRGSQPHSTLDDSWIFFDEVQYLHDWEIHLKSLVDTFPNCRFVVTGSATAALKLRSVESGAGRFTEFILPPLTFIEYLELAGRKEIAERVLESLGKNIVDFNKNIAELNDEFMCYLDYGGFPEAVYNRSVQQNKDRYLKSDILDKVLLRDIPSLYGISDIQELNRLFNAVAFNTAHEFSFEDLSQKAGIAKNTVKKYLEYLEAAYLIRRIRRIDESAKQFKRERNFKLYLTNPCIRSVLFDKVTSEDPEMGDMVETAIFAQLMHGAISQQLHYARWDKGEIDFVILDRATQRPSFIIESKWSDRIVEHKEELQHVINFATTKEELKKTPIVVTTRTTARSVIHQGIKITFIPASLYAYTLGSAVTPTIEDLAPEIEQ